MRRTLLAALLLVGCRPPPEPYCCTCIGHEREIAEWRAQRLAELQADLGWLTLAGLYWLDDGEHRLGAAADADIVFPAGAPAQVGTLTVRGHEVRLQVAPGVDARVGDEPVTDLRLTSDADPTRPPDRVSVGARFTFSIIARGDRLAVRLYDVQSAARCTFNGIPSFPIDGRWQIFARFEPFDPPKTIDHPTVLGTVQPAEVPGVAVFTVDGVEHRLTPIRERGPHGDELLFVFRDRTSGAETYTGGRFLAAAMPVHGVVALDFNRAHNPPCAFTPYATCPVPLPENRLDIRISAGEQTPRGDSKPSGNPNVMTCPR